MSRRRQQECKRHQLCAIVLADDSGSGIMVVRHWDMPDSGMHRRWTVIASGLLCLGLALVVLYTSRRAFFSPLAVVVVAAIGSAAVLLQLRIYNREHGTPVQAPMWLNVLGVLFALLALFSDFLHLSSPVAQALALLAVGSFAVGGALILHAFRKHRIAPK